MESGIGEGEGTEKGEPDDLRRRGTGEEPLGAEREGKEVCPGDPGREAPKASLQAKRRNLGGTHAAQWG